MNSSNSSMVDGGDSNNSKAWDGWSADGVTIGISGCNDTFVGRWDEDKVNHNNWAKAVVDGPSSDEDIVGCGVEADSVACCQMTKS